MNSVMGFKIDVINNNVSSRDPVRIIPVSGYVTYYLKRWQLIRVLILEEFMEIWNVKLFHVLLAHISSKFLSLIICAFRFCSETLI